jgi:hypothetical protein
MDSLFQYLTHLSDTVHEREALVRYRDLVFSELRKHVGNVREKLNKPGLKLKGENAYEALIKYKEENHDFFVALDEYFVSLKSNSGSGGAKNPSVYERSQNHFIALRNGIDPMNNIIVHPEFLTEQAAQKWSTEAFESLRKTAAPDPQTLRGIKHNLVGNTQMVSSKIQKLSGCNKENSQVPPQTPTSPPIPGMYPFYSPPNWVVCGEVCQKDNEIAFFSNPTEFPPSTSPSTPAKKKASETIPLCKNRTPGSAGSNSSSLNYMAKSATGQHASLSPAGQGKKRKDSSGSKKTDAKDQGSALVATPKKQLSEH